MESPIVSLFISDIPVISVIIAGEEDDASLHAIAEKLRADLLEVGGITLTTSSAGNGLVVDGHHIVATLRTDTIAIMTLEIVATATTMLGFQWDRRHLRVDFGGTR